MLQQLNTLSTNRTVCLDLFAIYIIVKPPLSGHPLLGPVYMIVGEPGLVGLVSFVFTLWRTQNKRNLPH